MKRIAEKLANLIYRENPHFTDLQVLKIQYGIECFLHEFTKMIVLLLIFSAASLFKEYLVVFAYMFILRPFTGGYHAKTSKGCYLISFIFISTVILASRTIELHTFENMALLLFSGITVLLVAPVEHPNKPIKDEKLRKRFKIIAVAGTVIAGFTGFLLPSYYSRMAFFTILCTAVMALLGHWIYRKNFTGRQNLDISH